MLTPWMQTTTFAIHCLCMHDEYVEPLRAELRLLRQDPRQVDKLPLLDSFVKESIRCNNSDAGKQTKTLESDLES